MTTRERLADLVELGDLDELVRTVDALVDERDWDGLVELRDRCRAALARGKQLWPIASLAEYRLALDAPGRWAAAVLVEGAGQFALGPLAEVAASTHPWAELAPWAPGGPLTALAAHERVVRGEDLTGDPRVPSGVLDLPLALQPWEPRYHLATYRRDRVELEGPAPVPMTEVALPDRPDPDADEPEVTEALVRVVDGWTSGGTGVALAVAVVGTVPGALRRLGVRRARLGAITAADGLARLAWAAASGGAHGRRRGAARGRFEAWWTLAALGGLLDEWPPPPDELGRIAGELRWFVWDANEPDTGWTLRLAVEDPVEGLAYALSAADMA